ncbi:MAG: methionyl-tRNA formyltransferase [Phycisphaerales bacterium]
MRVVYFGSGAFGLPTFEALRAEHEVVLVVTQPDRPAGRGRAMKPTPIGERAAALGMAVIKPQDVNDPAVVVEVRRRVDAGPPPTSSDASDAGRSSGAASSGATRSGATRSDATRFSATQGPDRRNAFVVIAFGQKLRPALLGSTFAINLHASILPRHRGAAPVNWAILSGDSTTGVTVITLAERMDAGEILAVRTTPIGPRGRRRTARPPCGGSARRPCSRPRASPAALSPRTQDESLATRAPKLSRADAVLSFQRSAHEIRCRVNGLSPWPGCTVRVGGETVRLLRVEEIVVDGAVGADDASIGVARPTPAQPAAEEGVWSASAEGGARTDSVVQGSSGERRRAWRAASEGGRGVAGRRRRRCGRRRTHEVLRPRCRRRAAARRRDRSLWRGSPALLEVQPAGGRAMISRSSRGRRCRPERRSSRWSSRSPDRRARCPLSWSRRCSRDIASACIGGGT